MKGLVFLLKTTVINYFKKLKQKPQKAIGPIFIILWLSVMFLPKGGNSSVSDTPKEAFVTIFVLITVIMFVYALYSGTKKINSKFDMSDVNLIFTAPIRPQTVMLYGIIKKISVELVASIYLIYQIPNFMRNFKVSSINEMLLIISFVSFQLVLCNVIKLFAFSIDSKYKIFGQVVRNFIKALGIVIVVSLALIIVKGKAKDFIEQFANTVTYATWVKYIPVFGWMREMALEAISGVKLNYGIYLALIFLLSVLLIYVIYNINMDYYEDMLSSAENNQFIKNAKNGNKDFVNNRKQPKFLKPFKKVSLQLKQAYGAKALFYKHINEYSKRSIIFFINIYSLILLAVSIFVGINASNGSIKPIFLIACLLLFFSAGLSGKIYYEISFPYIFLLPDSPQKKLFYGTASSLIKIFSDSLLLFLPFGILSRTSPLEILLCIVAYVTLGGMLSYSGLFAFRIAQALGFTGQVSQGILFMLFQLCLAVPAVIIVLVCTGLLAHFTGLAIYFGLILFSLAAAVLFSFGCVGIFNNMEL